MRPSPGHVAGRLVVPGPGSGTIASMRIARAGMWTTGGGVLAVLLSMILGGGPCNATLSGVVLLMLGLYVAIPVGVVVVVTGLVIGRIHRRA